MIAYKRHKVVPAVYLIAMDGEKLVFGRRQNTGYCDGMLGLISGHVEEMESPIQAMIREAKEEAGLTLRESDLSFGTVMARLAPDRECVDYFFYCDVSGMDLVNTEPQKCEAWKFYDWAGVKNEIIPYLQVAIDAAFKKQFYVEFGWDL